MATLSPLPYQHDSADTSLQSLPETNMATLSPLPYQHDSADTSLQSFSETKKEQVDSAIELKAVVGHEVADGGTKAWLTLFGSFLIVFCSSGYVNAFGVYEDFYAREFLSEHSSSKISWVGSMQIMFLGVLGIPAGYAMDRGYFRTVMILGSSLIFFSLLMSSFAQAQQWWQIFLSQGIGLGMAVGIVYVPALGILSHHFKRHRSIAMGIAGSGSSVGGVVYPIMLNYMFHGRVGFRWGVRISAFVTLFLLIVGNLLMSTTLPPRKDGKTLGQQAAYWKVFFKDRAYVLAIVSVFILYNGVFFPTVYMQLKATTHGISHSTAFWTIAALNGAGVFGRILPTIIVDKTGVFNLMTPCALACGALIVSFIALKDAAGIMSVSALYGFFAGALISLIGPMLAYLTVDVTEIGARLGVCIGIGAIGGMIGPPVSGALLTSSYQWMRPAIYSGVCCFASCVTFNIAKVLSGRRVAKSEATSA